MIFILIEYEKLYIFGVLYHFIAVYFVINALFSHFVFSLSRYKLKFSPDKVDTMIVQAISLLDDLDKELNNYIMRAREWYGWHFPELGKLVTDHVVFAKLVKLIGELGNNSKII